MLQTFLLIWAACLAGGVALWVVSRKLSDVSIVDVAWGPAFLVAAGIAFGRGGQSSFWHFLLLAMVAVWALVFQYQRTRRYGPSHGPASRAAPAPAEGVVQTESSEEPEVAEHAPLSG